MSPTHFMDKGTGLVSPDIPSGAAAGEGVLWSFGEKEVLTRPFSMTL